MKAICILLLFAMSAWARPRTQRAQTAIPTDPSYVSALAAANRFMHAWQTGDLENGMILLSDSIRHSQNADKLESFFSVTAERAFEIGAGHGNRGRYIFPVVLVATKTARVARQASRITMVDIGKNDWVVDKLP